MATPVGPWRWAFFFLWIQPPSCCQRISVFGDSCTIGRHFDAKGRHGGKNSFERRHLLLMEPVETALKTFDRRQGRRSKQTLIFHVLTALSAGAQRF